MRYICMQKETGEPGCPSESKSSSFITRSFTGLFMGLMQKEWAKTFLSKTLALYLDNIFKSREITLLTKVHLVKAVVFPVNVM